MDNKKTELERKYGLFTAICMVVGTVIGSGVFFKAQTVLQKTNGNMPMGIVAWLVGGFIMIVCILAFSCMAQKYERVNGLVDYAEATVGSKYGYYIGWFATTIYNPCLVSALAWLSARYTLVFVTSCWPDVPLLIPASEGGCIKGPECMALTLFYLCGSYAINALSPKLAGKFQTSTTIIKLIPLSLMAVGGLIAGIFSPTHMLSSNLATSGATAGMGSAPLLAAVCATAFAYEGWILTTSINAELKDAKKNLPVALIGGGIIVIIVYVAYYIGVAGGASVEVLMNDGATTAFTNVFGGILGNILNLFIAISCMGTMNGLMLACCRGFYALAVRKEGPNPELFSQVDKQSNMPTNSAVMALLFSAFWMLFFYITNLACTWGSVVVFKGTAFESVPFVFDSTELPIITLYAMYIPMFIQWMRKEKNESTLRRFVIPAFAVLGAAFMVYASIVGHKMGNFWYLIVFAAFMLVGRLLYKKK